MKPLHILVIEDVEADFLLISRHIRQSKILAEIKWAKDAIDLSAALEEDSWDLVLSDYNVPGLDFVETLQAIRTKLAEIPIILVSGSIGDEAAVELLKNGLCDFVLKDRLHRLIPSLERCLSVVADKSKREEAERKLAQNEQLMRAVLEGTSDAIFVKDRLGRYLLVNEAAARFVGHSADEIIGRDDTFLFQTEIAEKIIARDQMVMAQGIAQTEEEWITTRQGKHIAFVVSRGPIIDREGKVDGTFGVAMDITDRKKAELALAESELRYRALADSGQALIWTSGPDKKCDYFNQPWLAFTGRSLEQECGDGWIENIHPEDLEHCYKTYSIAFDQREKFNMEYRMRHVSGEYRWLQDNGTPRYDIDGNFMGYIGHCLEITDRKRAEEEQRQLQAQLHQAQKMESIGLLAGGVAHDYNNMLSVIMGYTEMAMDKVAEEDPLYPDLKEIFDAAKRSTEITRQLLAFARKQTICPTVLDLNVAIAGILKMLRRLIGEDINLAWFPGADLASVEMDSSQIDQILANLCVNARDAIGGVGQITIKTENVTIETAHQFSNFSLSPGEYAMLEVIDDGCGMDKKILDHIFEPFFTTKRLGQGTGLGLATVYGIVKQNNGIITVSSDPGQGTTCKIYIPRYRGPSDQIASEHPPAIPLGHGEKVLLVEDELAIRKLGKSLLESLGYRVIATGSPSEAIRLAEENEGGFDLLLTDVVMPGMSGRDLADNLHASWPKIKILYMSGYTSDIIAHRGVLESGVNFIHKPFTKNDLAIKAHQALARHLDSIDR